jgi:two-component system, sensor histidine kinase and response regulator
MRSKGLLELIAGPAAIIAILLLVLGLAIVGAPLLQQKKVAAIRMGSDMAITKAYALSEALLADASDGAITATDTRSYSARFYKDALLASAPLPAFEMLTPGTLASLRAQPQRPVIAFTTVYGTPHLIYSVTDGSHGVLVIDLPLERERALVGRLFGQSYLTSAAIGYVLIGLLLIGSFGLRHYLRSIAGMPAEDRHALVSAALQDHNPRARANLLPWLLLLCAAVFMLDSLNIADWAVGIGYILAVTLALSSKRPWHIMAIAALATLLLVMSPIVTPYDTTWWQYLENHSAIIFAILITGLFGSANMRKTEAEAVALTEATRARTETSELRAALERAEAAESERSEMVERLSMANEAAGISMWEWDAKLDVITLTGGGSRSGRLRGPTVFAAGDYRKQFVHPEDVDAYVAVFLAALKTPPGGADRLSIRYRAILNGRVEYVQLHGRLIRTAKGRVSKILGVDWEVTQEEYAKQEIARQAAAIQDARDRFQRAVAGARDALFEFNLRTGEEWYSPQLLQMLGHPPSTGQPPPLESFIAAEDLPKVRHALRNHLEHGAAYHVEYQLCQHGGTLLRVRARGAVSRDTDGSALWFAGSIADISHEWMAREAILRAAAEAETASKAKSTFLATMSHEIRTPMNGVIGMTGLLLDSGLDRVQRDYAETIRSSADSLLTILNDILDFSKIEAGKLDIETIELDLMANVEEVGSIMAFQAAAKSLELVVNVRPEVPVRVLGDPQRIRQCLINLVGNAIKFTHSGDVILEVCTVGQQSGRALVHFEVRDTGMGVSSDALQTLFQPFTQADSSTTRKFGGTGLGLSIVRRLVEMMGGQAGAHSEEGKGSTFWFTLPLEPASGPDNSVRLPALAHGRRVLLVDDNEANRRVLTSQMTHAGYDVVTAENGITALQILRQPEASFDAVVLDYLMPEMDGAALGEQIVKSKDIPPSRLVLLTSLDRSGDMQRFAEIGFSAYLTKPVRTRELLDCLQRSLSRDAEAWQLRSQPMITRGRLIAGDSKRQYSGTVLLVEDNPINQRVAGRFLERLGCQVQVVNNGQESIEAFKKGSFSIILMDMQMPVMDGVEATQHIRKLETGGTHTPIVALTANAMMGTLERCLEAGMDDYLTKPLDISRLQDVLDRFMKGRSVSVVPAELPAPEPGPVPSVSDAAANQALRARIQEIAGEDTEFALELMSTFIRAGMDAVHEMQAASVAENALALAQAAHKLKGSSANLHLHCLADLAQGLEARVKAGQQGDESAVLAQIEAEFERITTLLRSDITAQTPQLAASA